MYLRPLTDAEINQIREAKRAANDTITKQRQALAKEIKTYKYGKAPTEMVELYDALKQITGKPVFFLQGHRSMLLDYDMVNALLKSLKKSRYRAQVSLIRVVTKTVMFITYPAGEIQLNELPKYQEAVLTKGLPVIEIKEA